MINTYYTGLFIKMLPFFKPRTREALLRVVLIYRALRGIIAALF